MIEGIPPFYSEDTQEMYQKVLKGDLVFTELSDKETRSIISSFLTQDPEDRLTDPDEIKKHPYFATIDWEKLKDRDMTPPYIPPVKSDNDVSQFDETFTTQTTDSVAPSSLLSKTQQEIFENFSYSAPISLNGE